MEFNSGYVVSERQDSLLGVAAFEFIILSLLGIVGRSAMGLAGIYDAVAPRTSGALPVLLLEMVSCEDSLCVA